MRKKPAAIYLVARDLFSTSYSTQFDFITPAVKYWLGEKGYFNWKFITNWPYIKGFSTGLHSAFFLLNEAETNEGKKEGRKYVFNNALNTFFNLQLYGIRNMVKDHSDSKRGNPLLPVHGLLLF